MQDSLVHVHNFLRYKSVLCLSIPLRYKAYDLKILNEPTKAGYGSVFKQAFTVNAFLFFDFTVAYNLGSASISKPVHFRVFSKNSVFDLSSPVKAPHSTKNPPS